MNHIYRIIFNAEQGLWQAVAEYARGHGKTTGVKRRGRTRRMSRVVTLLGVAALPALAAAQQSTKLLNPGEHWVNPGSWNVISGNAVEGTGPNVTVENGAGSTITSIFASGVVIQGGVGEVINHGGAAITGGAGLIGPVVVGVVLDQGGRVENSGPGSIIQGSGLVVGTGVSVLNETGEVLNTYGAQIRGHGVAGVGVMLSAGGSVVNGAGSLIAGEGVGASVQIEGAKGTLLNAGRIAGGLGVALEDGFSHDVTLVSGGVIDGALNIGKAAGASLTLDARSGSQLMSQAVTGDVTFEGELVKTGTGVWTLDQVPGVNFNPARVAVNAGTLRAGGAQTFSVGAIYSVAAGAVLDLAGFQQTLKGMDLSGGGTVVLSASPSQLGTTLTTQGDWIGGGTVQMFSLLGGSGAASDLLVIDGGRVRGTTALDVRNADGLGADTAGGDGIRVVAGIHNADTTAQSSKDGFKLAAPNGHVDAGAYEYRLYAGDKNGLGEDWYLRSTVAPEPQPPGPEPLPALAYRAEVPLLSATAAQWRQTDMAMLGDLHKRVGDEALHSGSRRAWARVLRTDPRMQQSGTVTPQSDGHLTGVQAGVDLYAAQQWRAGLYAGQLEGDLNVAGNAGGGTQRQVGFNSLRNRYLGAYGTYRDQSGLYVDGVLQAADYRSTLHTRDNEGSATAVTRGRGWLASLEAGKSLSLSERWSVEPQAQLIYQHLRLDDTQLSLATVKNQADAGWTLRLGARVKGSFATQAGTFQPYGRVNLYKAGGTTDVSRFVSSAGVTDIVARGGYTSTELAGGASLQLNSSVVIYGEVGKRWSNAGHARVSSGVQGSVGVRVSW